MFCKTTFCFPKWHVRNENYFQFETWTLVNVILQSTFQIPYFSRITTWTSWEQAALKESTSPKLKKFFTTRIPFSLYTLETDDWFILIPFSLYTLETDDWFILRYHSLYTHWKQMIALYLDTILYIHIGNRWLLYT